MRRPPHLPRARNRPSMNRQAALPFDRVGSPIRRVRAPRGAGCGFQAAADCG
jgi:hypothetical protein